MESKNVIRTAVTLEKNLIAPNVYVGFNTGLTMAPLFYRPSNNRSVDFANEQLEMVLKSFPWKVIEVEHDGLCLIEYAGINISFDGVQLIVDPINLKRLSKSDAINVQRALNAEKEMREKVKSKMNSLPKKKVEKISDHILKLGDRVYLKNTHDLKIGKRVALRYRDENKQIEKESDSLSEKDMLLLKSAQSTELEILGVDNETGNYYVGAVIGNQGITFSVPKEFLIKSTKKR